MICPVALGIWLTPFLGLPFMWFHDTLPHILTLVFAHWASPRLRLWPSSLFNLSFLFMEFYPRSWLHCWFTSFKIISPAPICSLYSMVLHHLALSSLGIPRTSQSNVFDVECTFSFRSEITRCHWFWTSLCPLSLEMMHFLSCSPGLTTWGHP